MPRSTKIGAYDGTDDVDAFIRDFKIMSLYQKWDAATQLTNLPIFLHGKALRVYTACQTKTTIELALASIRTGCKPPNESLLINFYGRALGPSESISSYALELQDMLILAMPELQAEYQSSLLRAHLCLSLPQELQTLVNFTADNLTWDQLLSKLDQMDSARQSPRQLIRSSGSLIASSTQSSATEPQISIKSEPLDAFYADTSRSSYQSNNNNRTFKKRFEGNCSYCGIQGHKMVECRRKQREESGSQQNNFRQQNKNGRFQNQRGNNHHSTNKTQITTSNTIHADQSFDEFPFALHNNVLDIVHVNNSDTNVSSSSNLLKCNVELSLFNKPTITIKALIDSGSSHSFISPKILSDSQLLYATTKCKRQNFSIFGATGMVKCQCCIAKASISLASWTGDHQFIIANPVRKHDMIIGRDFLKKYGVEINHSNDTLKILDNEIHTNTVDVFGHDWLAEDLRYEIGEYENPIIELQTTELSPIKQNLTNMATISNDTIIQSRSQRLVELAYDKPSTQLKSELIMFEPTTPMPYYCLVGRSVHSNNSVTTRSENTIFCNVMNAGSSDIQLKRGQPIGSLSEIDAANIKFDEDIANFVPLDIEKVRLASVNIVPGYKPCLDSMIINDKLTTEQRRMLQVVLSMHEKVFQWGIESIGRTFLVQHNVPTGDTKPIQQKQYPIPSVAMDEIRKQTNQMIENKIIRPSKSPWRSPVLLVKKKDTSGKVTGYRFCIDLTKVNAVTTKDSYALPLIGKTTDTLCGAKYFSNGDLDRAFWQVGIAEEDKEKFSFVVDGKLLEPNVMPFGSMNAPSTFQRLVDRVLHGLTWKQCLVYLDDVLIFSSTFEQHLCDIHETLSRFSFASLKLKPSKCNFAKTQVEYLGFKISHRGIQASEKKIETIVRVKPPVTSKLLFSFLCSMTYYRKHIPNYGELTEALYRMCESKRKLCDWTPATLKSFSTLKQAFIQAPILVFPNYSMPFTVHTDASDKGISSVLLQMVNSRLHPIAFDGRKLTMTEQRYSATERELLAIVYAYDQNFHHVYGRHIDFYTDHKPLVTMNNLSKPHGRLGRLFHRLSGVDYTLHYIPGSDNYLADFLSRSFNPESKKAELNSLTFKSTIDWHHEQSKDLEIQGVARCLFYNLPETEWRSLKDGNRWFQERRNFNITDKTLMYGSDRIVVPCHMKVDILNHHHDSPFSGHRGFETTLLAICKRYYWNYLATEVKSYCQNCEKCQIYNYACIHNRAPLKSIVVNRPWQMLGLDFMGPFKTTARGKTYIIIGVDHFTKFVEGAATASFDSRTTALFVLNHIICRYGMVEQILTDQGVNFESHLFKHLCVLLGTNKLHTSSYHAAGNGITERVNKVVKPNLAKFVNDDHDDWDLYLQLSISSYNNSYHSTIKTSPYTAMFGRPPVLVTEVLMNNQLPSNTKLKDVSDFIKALRLNSDYICEMIRRNTAQARDRQKNSYDRFVKNNATFKVGDLVKINNFRCRPGHSKSFEPKFLGPFKIIKVLSELNYYLEAPNLKPIIVHYNRVSHYRAREGLDNKRVNLTEVPPVQQSIQTIAKETRPKRLTNIPTYKDISSSDDDSAIDEDNLISNDVPDNTNEDNLSTNNDQETNIVPPTLENPVVQTNGRSVVLYNDKGKPTVPCPNCSKPCEEKTGLRIHLLSCRRGEGL